MILVDRIESEKEWDHYEGDGIFLYTDREKYAPGEMVIIYIIFYDILLSTLLKD